MAFSELGTFLAARRAAASPEATGLQSNGRRRVAGLRREEVAMLAGVSVDYYARLEQGRERNPSASVLRALSGALDLAPDAREHLYRLANVSPFGVRAPQIATVDPSLSRLLDAWADLPAFVLNRSLDLLAMNALAAALYAPFGSGNLAEMVFVDPAGASFFHDWERAADAAVAHLRLALGYDPHDERTKAVVKDMTSESTRFAVLWALNDARGKTREAKQFVHPDVGRLTLEYSAFDVSGAAGQQLIVYQAEPGSSSADALRLLATLAATRNVDVTY